MFKIFKDLLRTKDPEKVGGEKYSQSRFYLLFSFTFMFTFLFTNFFWGVGGDNFEFIVDTTFYTMGFFGSYALVKKGMSHGQKWKELSEQREKPREND